MHQQMIMPAVKVFIEDGTFCSSACQFLMIRVRKCYLFGGLSFNGNQPYRSHLCIDAEKTFSTKAEVEG